MLLRRYILLSLISYFPFSTTFANNIYVAVAANFAGPMKQISQEFEQETGHSLTLSIGATANFYAQIKNGAPYQILLSADQTTPSKLVSENLAIAQSQFTYATGRLVLWSAKKDYVDDKGNILKSSSFKRLAIANPKLAPYGEAAFETLKNMNLLTTLENKIVFGDNINQTYQFVQSENAELGFVALSQIFMNGKITQGSAWLIPYGLHSPIKQDAVILNQGKNNDTVSSFMKYLHSEKCMKIIKNFGYEIE